MSASMLIPGAGMVQNIIEKMSDKIVAMVDEILTEKADAMMYEIIQPKIEECLKAIFTSSPVQLEAAKMFNREVFPIYKRSLDDFADVNKLINSADGKINVAFEEYTKTVIENKDDEVKKTEAKKKLMDKLKEISDTNVGEIQKCGEPYKLLETPENKFRPIENPEAITKYLTDGTDLISEAINQILNKTKVSYENMKENMKTSEKEHTKFNELRLDNMRIPGISACPNIENMKTNDKTLKDIDNDVNLAKLKELTEKGKQTLDLKIPDVNSKELIEKGKQMLDVKLPDVKLPDVKLPDLKLPDVKLPDLNSPDLGMNKLFKGGKSRMRKRKQNKRTTKKRKLTR